MTSASEGSNFNTEIIQWGCKYLLSHGYVLKSHLPENIQQTPWSYVVRFSTFDGYVYLKHTPDLLALEASIIQVLRDKFHISVPQIIAHNTELHCFLMKDAGRSLREILKQQFDVILFCKAINQFTSMQLIVADYINIFLDIGVPDWQLNKFPELYMQLLSQKKILIADGLSEKEINDLEKLLPQISILCKKLLNYGIKPSIVQPDFNDNNTLVDNISGSITMIDLGEIVISHPFFSLINCLQQAKKHYNLTDKDSIYLQLMDAGFKEYRMFIYEAHLLDAFSIARILFYIYEALSIYRLIDACDKERWASFFNMKGKLSRPLLELLSLRNILKTIQLK